MKQEILCTVCPRGCNILVEGEGGNITSVTGFGCKRGEVYAASEFSHPVRILTTTVLVAGSGQLLPVRSAAPVPKESLFDCMECIRKVCVTPPVHMHDVIIRDIAGTGVDMVASKSYL